jgi:predicted MPP superfamily phosphohydrolase
MARTARIPPRLRRALVAWALPALVGIVGAVVAVQAFAAESVPIGPFSVRLDASFGPGATDIRLPPLGRLRANTHLAPLDLSATLDEVDPDALQNALSGAPLGEMAAGLQSQALDRLRGFAVRVLLLGTLGALIAGALAYRRNRRALKIALLAGVIAIGGAEVLAYATYDPGAFREPSYTGTLRLAPQLLGSVQGAVERAEYFRDELGRIVTSAGRIYGAVEANPLGRGDELRVLHISDIHLSPLGMEFALQIAQSWDVDLVVDSGDTSSFGLEPERVILGYVPDFDRPYVWVRGSHDSRSFQAAVAALPNTHVLDGTTATVDGLTFYGLGDPYFVEDRGAPATDEEITDLVRSVDPEVLDDVEALPTPPDIVVVHDDRMAESVAGRVPLVLSGHFHRNEASVLNGTLYLQVGTTGGAGPAGTTSEGDQPLSAEILYFRPGEQDGRQHLVAYDVITQFAETGDLDVTRTVIEQAFGELTPSPGPSEAGETLSASSQSASP